MIVPVSIPPGIVKRGTDYESRGRWEDGSLVRWHDGVMQPAGGWQTYDDNTNAQVQVSLGGSEKPRSSFTWTTNAGASFLAIGTNSGLYSMSRTGTLTDITPASFTGGNADAGISTGYGVGVYGTGVYGAARVTYSNPVTSAAASWSFTTWGEDLIAVLRGRNSVYQWSDGDAQAAAVSNAPSAPTCVQVTDQRILMVGSSRTVSWSDAEDNTSWTPSSTNLAGSQLLEGDGEIVEIVRVRDELLVLTTTDAWVGRFVGLPDVYQFDKVGARCGCVSPQTLVSVDGFAVWLGLEQFYVYDGTVRALECDVIDYARTNILRSQVSTGYAFTNSAFNEVWWCYRSVDGTDIDRYISWNWKGNFWMVGALARNTMVDSGGLQAVIGVDSTGKVWSHEKIGVIPGTSTFVKSGPLETQNGEVITHVSRIFPDEGVRGDVQITLFGRQGPNETEYTYGPYSSAMPISTRAYGRELRMKVHGLLPDWRSGDHRFDVPSTGGRR